MLAKRINKARIDKTRIMIMRKKTLLEGIPNKRRPGTFTIALYFSTMIRLKAIL
jgi:hypothetical protein